MNKLIEEYFGMIDFDPNFDESKVPRTCENCEMYMRSASVCGVDIKNPENGEIVYGMPIEDAKKFYSNGCDAWKISYSAYEYYSEQQKHHN